MKAHGAVHRRRPRGSEKSNWVIDCPPYVMLRLKRVFKKIAKTSHGHIFLSDSPENCRDLSWFLERYPMEMPADDRAYLAARVGDYEAEQAVIETILEGEYVPASAPLAVPLREYQGIARDLVFRGTRSLLLADQLGLGKTAVAIGVIVEPDARPALAVTLTHLPGQWEQQIKKFAPGLRTHILKKTTPYDLGDYPDVIITSYSKLNGWADTLAGKVKTVIWDEGQELRTGEGHKNKAARHLAERAVYRIAMTATPIYNYGDEMFNVMECVRPGALGTREEFMQEWCVPEGGYRVQGTRRRAPIADPKAFGLYLRDQGLLLRRTRAEVGRELPLVTKILHDVDADLGELNRIKIPATELARIILAQGGQARGEKFMAAEQLSNRLRQATGIAKAPYVAAFVRILIENGERVLLYGWHHEVYALWREILKDLTPAFYTGQESVAQKELAKARFMDASREDHTPLLIMSLRAGAGLDGLQSVCSTCVFGELDWSPGVHEQNIGRLFRDGQESPVMAYFLITDVGSDPVVVDVLGLKRAQSEGIENPQGELLEQLQVDENHIRRLAQSYLEQIGAAP